MGVETIPISVTQIRANKQGFEALARLNETLSGYFTSRINIDCGGLLWLDAHLAAALMTIVDHSRGQGNVINLSNLDSDIKLILRKNGTLETKAADDYHTTIPISRFELNEEVDFADYSRQHLKRKEMPKMTDALLEKFFEGIDELFANCSLHSKSLVKVVSAGQFFPKQDKLAFVISDGGRGIHGSLKASDIRFGSDDEAINWAMQHNNTSSRLLKKSALDAV